MWNSPSPTTRLSPPRLPSSRQHGRGSARRIYTWQGKKQCCSTMPPRCVGCNLSHFHMHTAPPLNPLARFCSRLPCVCLFLCNDATLDVHSNKTHLKVKRMSHMRKKLGNKKVGKVLIWAPCFVVSICVVCVVCVALQLREPNRFRRWPMVVRAMLLWYVVCHESTCMKAPLETRSHK